ncbi:hypothetical protein J3Q64DRAFT_1770317 [Phycomyces blakesleeanus]|uniref:Arrestin C-terminal-like domain-containing protein n=1 Tax=Phycomyces blakesleeanus TaxID=4837 RepID=A0ABR3AN28_PHYBL
MIPIPQQPIQTMVNAIRKTNELRIDLTTDEIVLLGEADESAGKLLQGSLLLTLAEPIKMKVSWSEGVGHHQHYHKQERTILQHKWQFVPVAGVAPKKTYTLAAGHHKWDFELNLPGDLPESLETEGGRVSYGLKAVIERTAFVHNMVKKRSIRIIRCMLPSEFGLSQTLEIHNTWAEKMVYDIALPSKVYANGENIPISFNILPLASQLRVRFLTAFLKEYCTYTANDYSKTDTRMVGTERINQPFHEQDTQTSASTITPQAAAAAAADAAALLAATGTASPSQYNGYWTKVVDLKVPDASPLVFCDADNAMIRIRHKLKFVISLVNADGHYSELRCSVPIIIIDSFAQQAEISNLPAYDQSWRSVPYDPSVWDALRSGSGSFSGSTPLPPLQPLQQTQPLSINTQANTSSPLSSSFSASAAFNPHHSRIPSVDQERQPITISGRTRALSIASNSLLSSTPPSTSLAATDIPIKGRTAGMGSGGMGGMSGSGGGMGGMGGFRRFDPGMDMTSASPVSPVSMWWQGMDLSRVPSYRTAVQFAPANVSSSLPTYDSLETSPHPSR